MRRAQQDTTIEVGTVRVELVSRSHRQANRSYKLRRAQQDTAIEATKFENNDQIEKLIVELIGVGRIENITPTSRNHTWDWRANTK